MEDVSLTELDIYIENLILAIFIPETELEDLAIIEGNETKDILIFSCSS